MFGASIDRVDMAGALQRIRTFIESGGHHIVVTADASSIMIAKSDPGFLQIINSASLVTPDGAGLLWAAKRLAKPFIERVSGVDLVDKICEIASKEGLGVYFFGASPGTAGLAAENLKKKHPGMKIAGVRHGFFKPEESAAIAREIAESGADVLFVALGIPKQEKWIAEHIGATGVHIAMGIGGSFDVLSGKIKRAPKWMQRCSLEWLYRLLRDPKKIKKVAVLPRFVWAVLTAKRPK